MCTRPFGPANAAERPKSIQEAPGARVPDRTLTRGSAAKALDWPAEMAAAETLRTDPGSQARGLSAPTGALIDLG
jgi:hypothetical protein